MLKTVASMSPYRWIRRQLVAVLSTAVLVTGGAGVSAAPGHPDIPAIVNKIAQSLVIVSYTAENEFQKSRKISGQGIVLTKSGIVMISGDLLPEGLPLSYVHHLVIRIPRGDLHKIPAQYLGRTSDGDFCYLKALKPLDATPLPINQGGSVELGQRVLAVGLLSRKLGYLPYVGISRIKAKVTLLHQMCDTSTFGLTRANSPVFDYRSGKLLGITFPNQGTAIELSLLGRVAPVSINDPEQDPLFITYPEVKAALTNPPEKRYHVKRPWLGLVGMVGLKPALRKLYKIQQPAGVMIGSVIPHMPAAKAGLKSQDIILTLNGKEFSHSPIPDLMIVQFERLMRELKPGEKISLGILRDGEKHLTIHATVGVMPPLAAEEKHYYNHRLGLVVRNLVFDDIYARKLPAKQAGVIVNLVKSGAPASLGSTPLHPGYVITKLNDQIVVDASKFQTQLQAAEKNSAGGDLVFVVIKPNGNTAVCRIGLH